MKISVTNVGPSGMNPVFTLPNQGGMGYVRPSGQMAHAGVAANPFSQPPLDMIRPAVRTSTFERLQHFGNTLRNRVTSSAIGKWWVRTRLGMQIFTDQLCNGFGPQLAAEGVPGAMIASGVEANLERNLSTALMVPPGKDVGPKDVAASAAPEIDDMKLIEDLFGSDVKNYRALYALLMRDRGLFPKLALRGTTISIGGRESTVYVNLKQTKRLLMIRCVFADGSNVVKIFNANELSKAKHTIAAAMMDNALHLDLAGRPRTEIEEILLDFARAFELRNNTRLFCLHIGDVPIGSLLEFAVKNQESDRIRMVENGDLRLLCLFNKNWNGYVKSVSDLRAAEVFEETLGLNIQAAIDPGADRRGLDIRIYTEDPDFLSNLEACRRILIEKTVEARTRLSHILPSAKAEVVRIVLERDLKRKRDAHAYYYADLFRDRSFNYTDDAYQGERGAILLLRRKGVRESAYFISPESELQLKDVSLTAELRHHVHYRIWDSAKRREIKEAGTGLSQAVQEFIDDLQFIHDDRMAELPMRYRPSNFLFEWTNPYNSGHPLVTDTITALCQLLARKGVHKSDRSQELLAAIDHKLARFFIETRLRPLPPFFELAVAAAEDKLESDSRVPGHVKDSFAAFGVKFRKPFRLVALSAPHHSVISSLHELLNILAMATDSRRSYKERISRSEDPMATFDEILSEEFQTDLATLIQIGIDYYELYEIQYARANKHIGIKEWLGLRDKMKLTHARLAANLRDRSPLVFRAPNGNTYATQLEYMSNMEVLEKMVDQAIKSVTG